MTESVSPSSRSGERGDDECGGDDVAEGEAEGHVEAVLGAVRAQQADVLAPAKPEGVGRSVYKETTLLVVMKPFINDIRMMGGLKDFQLFGQTLPIGCVKCG